MCYLVRDITLMLTSKNAIYFLWGGQRIKRNITDSQNVFWCNPSAFWIWNGAWGVKNSQWRMLHAVTTTGWHHTNTKITLWFCWYRMSNANKCTDQSTCWRQEVNIHLETLSCTTKIPLRLSLSSLEKLERCFQAYSFRVIQTELPSQFSLSFPPIPCSESF